MSEQIAQPAEPTQDQPEQVATAEVENSNPFAAEVAAARASILGEPAEAPQDVEAPSEEVAEPEESVDDIRRTLASEKRARELGDQLKQERKEYEEKQREDREAREKYEAALADIEYDANSFLKEAKLSDEQRLDLAREIFAELIPEHMTPEIKAHVAKSKSERRIARLEHNYKRQSEAKVESKPEPPATPDPAEYEAYEASYKESLASEAASLDAKTFPLAAAFDAAELQDELFNVAVFYARNNPNTGDLTPRQTLEVFEEYLKRNPNAQKKSEQQAKPEETRPQQQAPRSLRNRTTAARPNSKQPQTFEEKFAAQREKALARL